jgi:hypothetical protein
MLNCLCYADVIGIPDFVSGATVGFMKGILLQRSVAIICSSEFIVAGALGNDFIP